jgi:hypothetical protein
MAQSDQDRPTQKTPKGHEIPVPKKADWERNLEKVTKSSSRARPATPPKDDS